jgi:hypothetical protein
MNARAVGPPQSHRFEGLFGAGESEAQPNTRDAPMSGGKVREQIERATLELGRIASLVESISDAFSPTMELLEAGYAIHTALVVLSDLTGGRSPQRWADSSPPTAVEFGWES